MKAAITAALSVLLLAGAAAPAFAETTIINTTAAPAAITAPVTITAPAIVASPATTVTRELCFPATFPGQAVQVVPVAIPAYAQTYGCPTMDYSMDYTIEPFGFFSDLGPVGGG